MKKVSVVIINYNGQEDTNECLKSLENVESLSFELSIIVIDNASKKPFAIEKSLKRNIEVLYSKENLGFSGGNNLGIKHSLKNGAEYIVLLNNDTLVEKLFINILVEEAQKHPNIGIVVPKIYFAKGYEFHKDKYAEKEKGRVIWYAGGIMDWTHLIGSHKGVDQVDVGQFDKEEETDFATGCCMLVKKEVFEKAGFLDNRYFLYYEDADLSIRVKKSGFKIIYAPKSVIWHKNAGSTGGSGSSLQDYFITRNRLLFATFYAPLRTKLALYRQSLSLLLHGRAWQKKGVLDFYLQKFGKGSFNL